MFLSHWFIHLNFDLLFCMFPIPDNTYVSPKKMHFTFPGFFISLILINTCRYTSYFFLCFLCYFSQFPVILVSFFASFLNAVKIWSLKSAIRYLPKENNYRINCKNPLSAACSAAVWCYLEVADPHHFYTDPDPPYQSGANLATCLQTLHGSVVSDYRPQWLHFEPLKLRMRIRI